MEVHISEKKILEDARSGDYFPEIYSQMARETRSEKATTSGYYYSQVFLINSFPFIEYGEYNLFIFYI